VANFIIASTPRTFDRESGQWRNNDPLFLRRTAWRQLAETAAESLARGARVIAQGRLRQKTFETHDGDKRTSIELDLDELGPSLRFATAKVTKLDRTTSAVAAAGTSDAPPF
jgi:single-strand DNA-binding protein